MKNAIKVFGIIAMMALIGYSFISCGGSNSPTGNGNAGGVFILTGIPEDFNDMHAILIEGEAVETIMGFTSMTVQTMNLPRIANGRVEIPMWVIAEQASRWFGYATLYILVGIIPASSVLMEELGDKLADARAFDTVLFVNGSATRTWGDGYAPF